MDINTCPISRGDWVPLGINLGNPARRGAGDRGKRSVAELGVPAAGGPRAVVQRDGYYRPVDGTAEFLTFWAASSRGWSQVGSFLWSETGRTWEPVDRSGPRPD